MYTHDINCAIVGARSAGAERIVVKDSHGNSKNLLIDELEPGVELVSGYGSRFEGMMTGIDSTYDAAMLVGYHAMAGSLHGVMEHTISGRVHRMWINESLVGEIGLSTITAGMAGVPIVAISSDSEGCAEARSLIPGVETATVKEGFGRYMARMLHPSESGAAIRRAAAQGLRNAPASAPVRVELPAEVRIEFNETEEADMAVRTPGAVRVDAYSVARQSDEWEDLHRSIWCMISLAESGAQANN